jgi:hypothetical protein
MAPLAPALSVIDAMVLLPELLPSRVKVCGRVLADVLLIAPLKVSVAEGVVELLTKLKPPGVLDRSRSEMGILNISGLVTAAFIVMLPALREPCVPPVELRYN